MKHVVVPIDGSEASLNAIKQTIELQKAFGAKVTVLHIIANPYKDTSTVDHRTVAENTEGRIYEEGKKMLDEAMALFPAGADVTPLLVEGPVIKALESVAASGTYDFMVMGTEGLGNALKRFLIGSVTKHVIEHVDLPVLVVR